MSLLSANQAKATEMESAITRDAISYWPSVKIGAGGLLALIAASAAIDPARQLESLPAGTAEEKSSKSTANVLKIISVVLLIIAIGAIVYASVGFVMTWNARTELETEKKKQLQSDSIGTRRNINQKA